MKIFNCGNCDRSIFFENYKCENCGHLSGFLDEDKEMLTFNSEIDKLISDREGKEYKFCKNHDHDVCNWLIEKDDHHEFCTACQFNRTIPNLSAKKNFGLWRNLEVAKHRLIYQLQRLGLPLLSKMDGEEGLCFDFVAKQNNPTLMTGHANGVITILLREADSVLREQTRKLLFEPYRTLIGHLRHEVGHYFWDQIVYTNPEALEECRNIFGDERVSYADSLKAHYENGAPSNWQETFISQYATSHPWEDWAETWAHYLHIMDMVETAYFFGMDIDPKGARSGMRAEVSFDPYNELDFDLIIKTCVPLSFAVNSINRAMGLSDVYPFVVNPGVILKMKFIHQLLMNKAQFS